MGRILVIDDDEQVRGALKQMLEREGHEVIEAEDGKVGIRLYLQQPTDLIITDILMPEIGGIDTISSIKGQIPEAKIVAISGGGTAMPAEDCLDYAERLGADRVFSKPVSKDDLISAVRELTAGATG
jgi:CheY-like chemotaxis protein